jgi:hypothetical protein
MIVLAAVAVLTVGLIALHSWLAPQVGSLAALGMIGGGLLLLMLILLLMANGRVMTGIGGFLSCHDRPWPPVVAPATDRWTRLPRPAVKIWPWTEPYNR